MCFLHLSLLFFLFIATIFWIRATKAKRKKYVFPKGPRPWPVVGNIFQFVRNPHLKFAEWAKKYGKLYTIYIGSTPTVVVTDAALQRKIFNLPTSTGKFSTESIKVISQGPYGIISSEGSQWQEQRHFCHKTLKQFGFGSGSQQEATILTEVEAVCDWIANQTRANNGVVYLNKILNMATNNTLWSMISGERVELEESKIVHLMERYVKTMQYTMKTGLGFFPVLKHIAPNLSGYNGFNGVCQELHGFIWEQFENHKKSFDKGLPARDLIDAYLTQLEATEKDQKYESFKDEIGKKNAVAAVVELFVAGSESTAAIINWVAFYLVQNEDIQNKLHSEIDAVIGKDRQPSLSDKNRMPFTEAVIMEGLRYASMTPQGIVHKLEEDTHFKQYYLPKGTLLLPNLYGIHHDPKIWGDPEVFLPERFLGKKGIKLKENLVPFQPGRRSCLGEQIAKDVLFLFITKLFQTFRVSKSPAVKAEQYSEIDVGLLLLPKQLGVVMEFRKK